MMWGWDGGFGFGGVFMLFVMVLFWGLFIAGIVYLVKVLGGSGTAPAREPGGNKALDILKERYARGEIDTEEYTTKKRELEG
ncbi:MAG: SHOCT domain-containing protein [Actinobacteria bacterium]|nr:SHOCT domain-containing protein [Actinomycetota bacterium]